MASHTQDSSFKLSSPKKEEHNIKDNVLLKKIEEESKSEIQNSARSNKQVVTKVNSPKMLVKSCVQNDAAILPLSRAEIEKTEIKTVVEELKPTPKVDEIMQVETHKELLLEVLMNVYKID